ncbi:MAG: UDP-glucose/GDP-mannose dehydrogenase family protein [Thermoplasmata archaeon]|nr:MAG: UDP-glucose/GDP-mannose dehydrogenase family protein [Thermoplasmata archaeon]
MKELKISLMGMGYVGLITGMAFAKHDFKVVVTDAISSKVEKLASGIPPFYEKNFEENLKDVIERGLLTGSTDNAAAVHDTDVTFICVGTPSRPDGSIDLSYIEAVAKDIGTALKDKKKYHVVVTKSTIVPMTTEKVILPILEEHSGKKVGEDFGLCMNPEFLREGAAVHDALKPDRIVIGQWDKKSGDALIKIYDDFNCPKLRVSIRTAEMIKYTANSFLATKITFANEMANLCERYNIDVYDVMKGVGLDFRISEQFLRAGAGFGGSCFPKDVHALVSSAKSVGVQTQLLDAVLAVNETQPLRLVELAKQAAGGVLKGKEVALLGLAFKPDTDDIRETRAVPILNALVEQGAKVRGYDPEAMENFKAAVDKPMVYAKSAKEALEGADICIIQTEWNEIKELTAEDFKSLMKTPVVVDGRRTFDDPQGIIDAGVKYLGIGWKNE